MDAAVIAVMGTLGGTALGAGLGHLSQRAQHRQEANERLNAVRRDVYVGWPARAEIGLTPLDWSEAGVAPDD